MSSRASQNGPIATSMESVASSQSVETHGGNGKTAGTEIMASEATTQVAASQNAWASTSSSSSVRVPHGPATASSASTTSSHFATSSHASLGGSGRSYGKSMALPKPMKSATTSLQRFGKPQQIAANGNQSARSSSSSSSSSSSRGNKRGRGGSGGGRGRGGVSHSIVGKRPREDGSPHFPSSTASINGGVAGEKRSASASNMPRRKAPEKASKGNDMSKYGTLDGHDFRISISEESKPQAPPQAHAASNKNGEDAPLERYSPAMVSSYMSDPLFLTDRVAQRVLNEFHSAWKSFSKPEGKAKYILWGSWSVPKNSIETYILKRDPCLLSMRGITSISDTPDDRSCLNASELEQALEHRKHLWLTKYSSKCGEQRKGAKRVSGRPFRGVIEKNDDSWMSQIKIDGKVRRLGRFASVYEAARAYDRATMQARRVKSYLNFPTEYENAYYTADTFVSNAVNARSLRSNSVAIVKDDISKSEETSIGSVKRCDFVKISNRLEHWCYVCNDAEGVEWCEGCGCSVCFSKMDKEHMLCCSICYSEYHVCCLNVSTLDAPGSSWRCPRCVTYSVQPSTESSAKTSSTDTSCSPGNWNGLGLTRRSAKLVSEKLSQDIAGKKAASFPGNQVETSADELSNHLESVIDPRLEVAMAESTQQKDCSDELSSYSVSPKESEELSYDTSIEVEGADVKDDVDASMEDALDLETDIPEGAYQVAPTDDSSDVPRSASSRQVATSSSFGPVLTPVEEAEVRLTGRVCCDSFGHEEAIVERANKCLKQLHDSSGESSDPYDDAETMKDVLNSSLICPSLRARLHVQEEDQDALKRKELRDCLFKRELFPSPPRRLNLKPSSSASANGDGSVESGDEGYFQDLDQLSGESSPSSRSQMTNSKEKKLRQPIKEKPGTYREMASRLRSKKIEQRQQASSQLREVATSVGNLRKRAGMVALRSLRYPLLYSRNGRMAGSESDPRGSFATALALPPSSDTSYSNERTSMPNEKNVSDSASLDSKGEKIRRKMYERGIESMLEEEREGLHKKYKMSAINEYSGAKQVSANGAPERLNGCDGDENGSSEEGIFSSLDDAMGFLCSGMRMFRTSKDIFGGNENGDNATDCSPQVNAVNGSVKGGKAELREDQVIDISSIEQLIRNEREHGRSEHSSQTAASLRLYQELMHEFGLPNSCGYD